MKRGIMILSALLIAAIFAAEIPAVSARAEEAKTSGAPVQDVEETPDANKEENKEEKEDKKDKEDGEDRENKEEKEDKKDKENGEDKENKEVKEDEENQDDSSSEKQTGKKSKKKNYTKNDLRYLSAIIFCEANSHTRTGMIAVANVVLNRRRDTGDWAHVNTIKEVIYDRGPGNKWGYQFSPTRPDINTMPKALDIYDNIDSYMDNWRGPTMLKCIEAAKAALNGEKSVPDSYMYFNGYIHKTQEKCFNNGKSYMIISGHIYY